MPKRGLLVVLAALAGSALAAAGSGSITPIDIGSRLELFVDDLLVDSAWRVQPRMHEPRSAGKALSFDKPWEGNTSLYVTVFQDGDRVRMYYRGSASPEYNPRSGLAPGDTGPAHHPEVACYAESRDGITWTKPALGLHEFNGSRANAIVWTGTGGHNFAPFKDDNPAAPPSERYKALAGGPLIALKSADGLRWEKMREAPVISDGAFDSQNVAFWDAQRGEYVAIYRDFQEGVRTIKCATSKNFLDWTPGRWADYGSAPPEHLYTNATVPYFRAPHIYLGFPKRFMPFRAPLVDSPYPGLSDTVLMTSRDGVHWMRQRESYIRPGRDGRNWVHRTNMTSRGIIQTAPDELSLYVARNYTHPSAFLERMVLRVDGFMSMHAGFPDGELRTKPIVFKGSNLVLNYATSAAGSIRIEIQNARGDVLPGFSLEESPVLYGDRIDQVVQWSRLKSQTDNNPLKRVAGMPVRLRFVMRDADLYSIRFQ